MLLKKISMYIFEPTLNTLKKPPEPLGNLLSPFENPCIKSYDLTKTCTEILRLPELDIYA